MGKLIIFGHRGMLGHVLQARTQAEGFDLPECDITDRKTVLDLVQSRRPEIIINCAAFTQVDAAEAAEEKATRINGVAVGYLAEAAREVDAYFLTISTDYVFPGEGETPYKEDDPVGPQCAYGRSKLAGEEAVRSVGGRWAIARTQWLYGQGGKNFIDTIARLGKEKESLKVVNDQVGAPTWTVDLTEMLIALTNNQAQGIYHTANSGYASWYEVASLIIAELGLPCKIIPCTSAEYPLPAKRPNNSRLNLDKITALMGKLPRPWQLAVREYLRLRIGN